MKLCRPLIVALVIAAGAGSGYAQQEQRRNFASCPVVQDTKTVPCWLAEYGGELYYLGIQSDSSAEFHPPYLGHKVLVEGVISNEPRICGGIVLKPVVVSPLIEPDPSCNTILPALDKYTVPNAPRPPGPSDGTLAFQTPAPLQTGAPLQPPFAAKEFSIYYDFDAPVMGRHAAVLTQIMDYAEKIGAKHVIVSGYRGATLLSDKAVLTERPGISKDRAEEVADLLERAGLSKAAIQVTFQGEPEPPHGVDDWKSRRTTVRVEP
ncbi:MAG TPA: OmpA family protein [Terriglobia bacterium]|jgi:outer membrane protein OmpA-like peptidoglycan-associated protein